MSDVALADDTADLLALGLPDVEIPLAHHFGPGGPHGGIYAREVTIPAHTFVLGASHRYPTMNMMLKGRIVLLIDGQPREFTAPMIFNSPPGRKMAYAIEEVVWLNVFSSEETDVDTLEAMLIEDRSTVIDCDEARAITEYVEAACPSLQQQ